MWICGTFDSDAIAKVFYDKFTKDLVGDNALAMAGVYSTDFCKLFPGVTININSYEYKGVYDKSWGSKGVDSYTWEPLQSCPSCDVHYTYTCPLPPPPCNTCWKWSLSGCKNNYYGGLNCNKALNQFKWYLSSIGYLGECLPTKPDAADGMLLPLPLPGLLRAAPALLTSLPGLTLPRIEEPSQLLYLTEFFFSFICTRLQTSLPRPSAMATRCGCAAPSRTRAPPPSSTPICLPAWPTTAPLPCRLCTTRTSATCTLAP